MDYTLHMYLIFKSQFFRASEALHMVSCDFFVKSMTLSFLKLQVTPLFSSQTKSLTTWTQLMCTAHGQDSDLFVYIKPAFLWAPILLNWIKIFSKTFYLFSAILSNCPKLLLYDNIKTIVSFYLFQSQL